MKRYLLIGAIVIVGLGVIGGGIILHRKSQRLQVVTDTGSSTASTSGDPKNNTFSQSLSRGKCQSSGTVEFSHLPMNIDDIGNVLPYGTMVGAHVIPTSHGYISPTDFQGPRDQYPVFAIADSTLVQVSHRGQAIGDNQDPNHKTDEYQLWFEHSCTFYSYYDLLTSLSSDLLTAIGGPLSGFDSKAVRIPIKAGQEVGRVGGQTVDFGVWNFEKTPDFFANAASYEPDRPYLDDMFKYFAPDLKAELLTKAARKAEPQTGKVNYDIAGKLVGGWFQEGTGGFQGPPGIQQGTGRYWDGHLAIAYDYIDPTSVKISVGNWPGGATQFAVKGNAPDPATIDIASGVVKYELTPGGYINGDTGAQWMIGSPIPNPKFTSNGSVQGVVLFQLTAADKLKVEFFPGKTAAQVTDFTPSALNYTR